MPIKYSGWKSNWELSTARALSVLHNMVEAHKVKPNRLAAIGHGEYKPVASNNTNEGMSEKFQRDVDKDIAKRRKNR